MTVAHSSLKRVREDIAQLSTALLCKVIQFGFSLGERETISQNGVQLGTTRNDGQRTHFFVAERVLCLSVRAKLSLLIQNLSNKRGNSSTCNSLSFQLWQKTLSFLTHSIHMTIPIGERERETCTHGSIVKKSLSLLRWALFFARPAFCKCFYPSLFPHFSPFGSSKRCCWTLYGRILRLWTPFVEMLVGLPFLPGRSFWALGFRLGLKNFCIKM